MSIIRQLTENEADLAAKDALVLQAGEATHYLASILCSTNSAFWSLPTDRLLAVLNADVGSTIATFQANTALGMQVNASLDALGVAAFTNRAPTETGRTDIIFNGAEFVFVPPVVTEPAPEQLP